MPWCCTCHNYKLVLTSEEEIIWYLPKFLRVYVLEKVACWCLGLHDPSSYCSIMLRGGIPVRREAVFSCNKNPSKNICFVFWVLLPAFSVTFLKTHHFPLLSFPSHPPCVCCVLFIILSSKRILNAFIISQHWFVCLCKSLAPISHLEDSWRNQWAAHCRKLCGRLYRVALLWQLDPKSTGVEEFHITSAQTIP